jgi:hypothetical protein
VSMSTGSSQNPVAKPSNTPHRVRVIIFRSLPHSLTSLYVVAVVLMASAPWVLVQPDQVARTELNWWFLTVAGSVDAIAAGVLLALALRAAADTVDRRTRHSGDCRWRDHSSVPALVRCDSRHWSHAADRLPVLARGAGVSVLVSRRFA